MLLAWEDQACHLRRMIDSISLDSTGFGSGRSDGTTNLSFLKSLSTVVLRICLSFVDSGQNNAIGLYFLSTAPDWSLEKQQV